jgi:hypothetical protein
MKAYGDMDISLHIFLISALAGDEWSASRPGRFTHREWAAGTHWIVGWVGPRADVDDVERRKILFLAGLELRTPRSLCRLRYATFLRRESIIKKAGQGANLPFSSVSLNQILLVFTVVSRRRKVNTVELTFPNSCMFISFSIDVYLMNGRSNSRRNACRASTSASNNLQAREL